MCEFSVGLLYRNATQKRARLRGIYLAAGLSVKPRTKISKIDALKEIIRAWGMNPEEILTRQALTEPHRTVIDRCQLEQSQLHQLSVALKQQMLKEIRESQDEKSMNSCLSNGSPGEIRTLVSGSRAISDSKSER